MKTIARLLPLLAMAFTLPAPANSPASPAASIAVAGPQIDLRSSYFLGEVPQAGISGLKPGETVAVHLFRTVVRWLPDGESGWKPVPTLMHGWARYQADASGRISLSSAAPTAGTSMAVGAETLFWSARRQGDLLLGPVAFAEAGLTIPDNGTHVMRISRGDQIVAERKFQIGAERGDMIRAEVNTPNLTGFFAAPRGAKRLPVLIHLHGSEGGSISKSRDIAQRYAELGFATFAVAYFAWPYEAKGLTLPSSHRNIPVELLDRARSWLAQRGEADVSRIALVGNSKGAEFAMVGAATYPWIKAAVGCVPSDVVWEGFGAVSAKGEVPAAGTYSSWSWRGKPLPYLPAYAAQRDGFVDNTDRYDRARAEFPTAARAARIPIERSRARLFLIGGDRDRTWSSGGMVKSIANAMDAAKRGDQVETFISATGGHYLCGDGLYPQRAWQDDSPSPFAPEIDAQGQAEVAAHRAKIAFLYRVLGVKPRSQPIAGN